jgi:hypothetical protein
MGGLEMMTFQEAGERGYIDCIVDGHHGIYVPQQFAKRFQEQAGLDGDDLAILLDGPDNKHYWDVWGDVLDNGTVTDRSGNVYSLYQDDDLFAIDVSVELDPDSF